jgi:hypothetical protein
MRFRTRVQNAWLRTAAFLAVALTIGSAPAAPKGQPALGAIVGRPPSAHSADAPTDKTPSKPDSAGLTLNFECHTDDLDAMVKRRNIRALVFYSRSGFFYVSGRPQGIYYEALRAFEQSVNQKLQTGKEQVQIMEQGESL